MSTGKRAALSIGICLLFTALAAVDARAQERGRIAGTLQRADGSPVSGASVVVAETGATTLTDERGGFTFSLPAGTYSLSLTLAENAATRDQVTVTAGQTLELAVTVDWQVSFAEMITVTSASRRAERIVDAPAAVTLVTSEEIARQAAHGQVPKLLEFTPGAEVTQSGVYDYNFNTRGFNSSLNRRVATLIDGRNPAVPFLGAQEWAAISFPLDDLASVELVRGPSAALYGANASSGVLNMVTKQPRYSRGGELRLTGGELSTLNADFRWATSLGSDWYMKLLGGARDHDDFTVSRRGAAEYSVPCNAGAGITKDCLPQESVDLARNDDRIYFGGLRFDKYLANGDFLTLEGGQANIKGPAFQTGIGRVQLLDVERPWARANYSSDHFNVLGYYNQRKAPEQLALAAGTNLSLDSENYQFEVQGNWGLASDRGRLVLGASYGEEDIDSFDPRQGAQTLIFAPVHSDKQALFAQLDWGFSDKLRLVVAGRFDDSSLHARQFSPKASLVWSVTPHHTLRFTYNEAFQVPNYSEFFLQANAAPPVNLAAIEGICTAGGVSCGFAPGPTRILALGNKDLELEEVETLEVGYSGILGDKAFLTIDYYNSDNRNFITDLLPQLSTSLGRINPNFGPYQPPAGLVAPLADLLLATLKGALGPSFAILSNNVDGSPIFAAASYTNFGKVNTQGVDLGLAYYFSDDWTLNMTYSWFDFNIQEDAPGLDQILLPNSPENKVSAGLAYVGERFDAQLSGRWVDTFRWVVGPFQGDVESYTTLDLTANYAVNDHWRVGANIANLFDDQHWEAFGGDLLGRRALGYVSFNW